MKKIKPFAAKSYLGIFILLLVLAAGCREKYGPTQSRTAGYIVSDGSNDTPAPILITSPAQGEIFHTGANLPISWQTRNAGAFVKIELFRDNTLLARIASGIFYDQKTSWSIPRAALSSEHYMIRITDQNNNEISATSHFFTIRQIEDPQ